LFVRLDVSCLRWLSCLCVLAQSLL